MDAPEIRRQLGARLRELRLQQGLTQEQLAERIGVHPTYVAKIERGVSLPALTVWVAIARALGITPARFFESLDPPAPDQDALEVPVRKRICDLLESCHDADRLQLIHDMVAVLVKQSRPTVPTA